MCHCYELGFFTIPWLDKILSYRYDSKIISKISRIKFKFKIDEMELEPLITSEHQTEISNPPGIDGMQMPIFQTVRNKQLQSCASCSK